MNRLRVGIDGNALYVGFGDMPEGDFVFETIDSSPNAKPLRTQARDLVDKFYEEFPKHARLPFDYVDGL